MAYTAIAGRAGANASNARVAYPNGSSAMSRAVTPGIAAVAAPTGVWIAVGIAVPISVSPLSPSNMRSALCAGSSTSVLVVARD